MAIEVKDRPNTVVVNEDIIQIIKVADSTIGVVTVGTQGMAGTPGADGSDGAPGAQGSQGVKGDTGDSGVVFATAPVLYNAGTKTVSLDASVLLAQGNLSALTNMATARTNLGLGTAATHAHADYEPAGAVSAGISALVAGAPGLMDTLLELSSALGNDPNFAATMATALGNKQPINAGLTSISALATTAYGRALLTMADAAAVRAAIGLATVANSGLASDLTGTLADAQLSANVMLLSGAQVASGAKTFEGVLATRSPSDTSPRVQMLTGISMGDGTAAVDLFLVRYAATTLKLTGTVGTVFALNGASAVNRVLRFVTNDANRWDVRGNSTAEGGGNSGTNFEIVRYADNGVSIDNPFSILRSSGKVTMTNVAQALGFIVSGAAATVRQLAFNTGATLRWDIVADSSAEGGANAGSNLNFNRYSDAGASLGTALSITRSTGKVIIPFLNPGSVRTIVALTDAATVAVDASLATEFRLLIGGNRTLGAPTNPTDGQIILFKIKQDATGSRTLAYNAVYRFSTDIPQPTLSTVANKIDYLEFKYDATDTKWDLLRVVKGFN